MLSRLAIVVGLSFARAALGQNTPEKLHELRGHPAGPLTVAFSPDGKAVLTTTRDPEYSIPPRRGAAWSLRRWDATTGAELAAWKQDQETEVRCTVFSPDGAVLARANNSGTLTLVDTRTGAEIRAWSLPWSEQVTRIPGHDEMRRHRYLGFDHLLFSPDGTKLGATRGRTFFVWDRARGKRTHEVALCEEPGTAFAGFMPDGSTVMTYYSQFGRQIKQGMRLFDLETATPGRELDRPRGAPQGFHASPTGHSVVVHVGVTTSVYELATGKVRVAEQLRDWVRTVALSPDGRLFAQGGGDGGIRLRSLLSGSTVAEWPAAPEAVTSIAFSPDGQRLVSAAGNTAIVWDLSKLLRNRPRRGPAVSDERRQHLWNRLGARDPREAAAAIAELVDEGRPAAAFLARYLKELPPIPPEKIERWIVDLDSPRFSERESAMRSLDGVGDLAAPALRKALAETKSEETRRRVEKLLAGIKGAPAAWLQTRRSLEVLEIVGAVDELQALSTELPDPTLREEVKTAVQRIKRRTAK